jgi:type IV secretion system protein VirB1
MKPLLMATLLCGITPLAFARDPKAAEGFPLLAADCTPNAPLNTLRAMVRVESNFYANALSVNQPKRTNTRLTRQPQSKQEALAWTRWLLRNNYTVSVGLMQVNSVDATQRGIALEQLLDPCLNIKIGWQILTEKYQAPAAKYGPGQKALLEALSLYNSGSPRLGFSNGYVARVIHGEFPTTSPKEAASPTRQPKQSAQIHGGTNPQ